MTVGNPFPSQVPGPAPINYASPASQMAYASFGQRLGAWVIDWFVLGAIRFVLILVLGAVFSALDHDNWSDTTNGIVGLGVIVLMIVAGWLYHAILESSTWQGTLGKQALAIQVADIEEGRATFIQTSVRYLTRIFSSLTLGFGFLMILFTKRHQALHDIGANCVVVRRVLPMPPPLPEPHPGQPAGPVAIR